MTNDQFICWLIGFMDAKGTPLTASDQEVIKRKLPYGANSGYYGGGCGYVGGGGGYGGGAVNAVNFRSVGGGNPT